MHTMHIFILSQGLQRKSGRPGDRWPNVLNEMVSLALRLQARNTHIVCTDPCQHKLKGPNVKESGGDLRMSRF